MRAFVRGVVLTKYLFDNGFLIDVDKEGAVSTVTLITIRNTMQRQQGKQAVRTHLPVLF